MWFRFGAVVFVLTATSWAQAPDGRDPAGPRVGSYYDVTIVLTDVRADLDHLTAGGYNITSVDGNVATLVATAEELLWLGADGYDITRADEQNPGRASKRGGKGLGVYHSYATLTSELSTYASTYASICKLESLGQSTLGREIWALKITDKPNKQEAEPEFKYVSTMHGDELVGTEMCLYFIDELLTNYGTDNRITTLVDTTEIWIVPLMNPDGLEADSRFNDDGIDLNRNFPTWPEQFSGTIYDGAPLNAAGRALETQRVMEWSANNSFVLSANFHGGARIVNYPYDDNDLGSGVDSPTAEDALFRDLALRYATPNTPMSTNSVPTTSNGIINGALWYEITGGMQDWNYRYLSCNDVTIELSENKSPNESNLPGLWDNNRESMLAYAEAVHIGIRGIVKDKTTKDPIYARILVDGNPQPVFTDPDKGDYYRLLLPGTYTIKVSAPGYKQKKVKNVIVTNNGAVQVNVKLNPAAFKTDLNGDGKTNSIDIQRVVSALLTNPEDEACDVDDNGTVDVSDLQHVVVAVR